MRSRWNARTNVRRLSPEIESLVAYDASERVLQDPDVPGLGLGHESHLGPIGRHGSAVVVGSEVGAQNLGLTAIIREIAERRGPLEAVGRTEKEAAPICVEGPQKGLRLLGNRRTGGPSWKTSRSR